MVACSARATRASRLLVRLARWSRSACSRMRVATSSLIEASGETTGMVVGGQSAVGDQYPGGRQLGPAGDAGQLELAGLRLGCGGELAVAGARRDRLGRDAVGEPVPVRLVDDPAAALQGAGVGSQQLLPGAE